MDSNGGHAVRGLFLSSGTVPFKCRHLFEHFKQLNDVPTEDNDRPDAHALTGLWAELNQKVYVFLMD